MEYTHGIFLVLDVYPLTWINIKYLSQCHFVHQKFHTHIGLDRTWTSAVDRPRYMKIGQYYLTRNVMIYTDDLLSSKVAILYHGQSVNHWLLIAQTCIHSQVRPCGIYGRQNGTEIDCTPCTNVSYSSTSTRGWNPTQINVLLLCPKDCQLLELYLLQQLEWCQFCLFLIHLHGTISTGNLRCAKVGDFQSHDIKLLVPVLSQSVDISGDRLTYELAKTDSKE